MCFTLAHRTFSTEGVDRVCSALQFHHRDPGLVGLLTTLKLGQKQIYYGIIADGYHTDETVLRIAYKSNPTGTHKHILSMYYLRTYIQSPYNSVYNIIGRTH